MGVELGITIIMDRRMLRAIQIDTNHQLAMRMLNIPMDTRSCQSE